MRDLFPVLLLATLPTPAAHDAAVAPRYVVDASTFGQATGQGLWRPTEQQAHSAEAALRRFLAGPRRNVGDAPAERWNENWRNRIGQRLNQYVLQFAGVRQPSSNLSYETEGEGPKQIYIQGICRESARDFAADLSNRLLSVSDGGQCIFEARYDLLTKTIVFFSVHGVG